MFAPTAIPAARFAPRVGSRAADAPTDVAGAATRGIRALAIYGMLVTGGLQSNLPWLMDATGLPGAVIVGVAFLPVYALAVHAGFASFRSGPLRALLALVALVAMSTAWSEHATDGFVKTAAMATALGWGAILTRWPELLRTVLSTGIAYALVGEAASAAGVQQIPPPNSSFLVVVVLAAAMQWRMVRGTDRLLLRALRTLTLVALLALVFLSSFRAPTIGAVLVVVGLAVRSREARFALVIAALAGGVYFTVMEPAQAPSYARTVERDDLVGRYEAISSDGLSGRADIWDGVLAHVREHPSSLIVGGGLGDVDFVVANANPRLGAINRRGERVLHSHNLALEILIAAGVPGFAMLLWLVASLLARLGTDAVDWGVLGCAVVLSGSNVPLIDPAGGTLLVAMLCVQSGRRPEARWFKALFA